MKEGLTELVFIIDKSGSMAGLENDTIGGFNSMLNDQKNVEGDAVITTVLFDTNYEIIHDRVNINEIKPMTTDDYIVGGGTALLDAIGKTVHKIRSAQKRESEDLQPEKVMFVVITDGEENSSCEYNYQIIKKIIEHYRDERGWEFIFFGANIDAIKEASKIGISANRVQSYTADSKGITTAYQSMSMMSTAFRTNSEPKTVGEAMANLKVVVSGLKDSADELADVFKSIEANGGKFPNVNKIASKVIGKKRGRRK